jgi:hypothetical protein
MVEKGAWLATTVAAFLSVRPATRQLQWESTDMNANDIIWFELLFTVGLAICLLLRAMGAGH